MSNFKNDTSRREFLSKTIAGISSVSLAGAIPALNIFAQGKDKIDSKKAKESEVIYRTLGKTGIKVPIIGMGVMNADLPELVRKSYEIGIRHFDTAAGYQKGRNEEMVGDIIKELGVRKKVIIGTKVYIDPKRRGEDPSVLKKEFLDIFEGSLKRLQTNYVDILYLHNVSNVNDLKNPGFMEALASLKKQKKIRHIGVSTHGEMAKVIDEAIKMDFYEVILTAINVTMKNYTELLDGIKRAADKGIGIVAMKTQAGGRRFKDSIPLKEGEKMNQTALLKWVLKNENITMAIPGYTNYDHMYEDFSVSRNLEYTPEEKKFLEDKKILIGMGFCRQCSKCITSCPNNIDIPNLMRTHMYAAQYNNFQHAKMTLNEISPEKGLKNCDFCDICSAKCSNNVNIPFRINELKSLYA